MLVTLAPESAVHCEKDMLVIRGQEFDWLTGQRVNMRT